MDAISLTNLILIPLGLGLLGFIEPCTSGVSLWAVKYLEGESGWSKARHMLIFSLTRALLIGMLGVVAALLGSSFFIFQQGMWLILGLVYGGLGLLYLSGRSGWLSRRLGPSLNAVPHSRGSVFLGLVLGLNIPRLRRAAPVRADRYHGDQRPNLGSGLYQHGPVRPGALGPPGPGRAVAPGPASARPSRRPIQSRAALDGVFTVGVGGLVDLFRFDCRYRAMAIDPKGWNKRMISGKPICPSTVEGSGSISVAIAAAIQALSWSAATAAFLHGVGGS